MTRLELQYDILQRLSQNSDDSQLEIREIDHWINLMRANLLTDWIKKNGEIPAIAIKQYDCVALSRVYIDCERCYEHVVDLPVEVLSLPDDGGVTNIYAQGGRTIEPAGSKGRARLMYRSRFGPKEAWYRQGNKINLIGHFMKDSKFRLELVPRNHDVWGEDEEYPAPADIISQIQNLVTEIGITPIKLPEDIHNDGKG